MSDEIRRNMALFSIGSVMKLTELTARQIRYYEQHELVLPTRTEGNQRLFSLNDIERLMEIKSLIEKGVNIAGIKQVIHPTGQGLGEEGDGLGESKGKKPELSEDELHRLLKQDLIAGKRLGKVSIIQGELSRFYNNQ